MRGPGSSATLYFPVLLLYAGSLGYSLEGQQSHGLAAGLSLSLGKDDDCDNGSSSHNSPSGD